jgi:hypothetical protein
MQFSYLTAKFKHQNSIEFTMAIVAQTFTALLNPTTIAKKETTVVEYFYKYLIYCSCVKRCPQSLESYTVQFLISSYLRNNNDLFLTLLDNA